MQRAQPEGVVFWLDRSNTIVRVNPAWDIFAQANGGTVLSSHVLGRSLFDYLVGEAPRMYVDVILEHSRTLAKQLVRPYRCDSPGIKRYMEMRITPEASGELRLEHRCLAEDLVQPQIHFRYRPGRGATKRCSVCNRINRNGRWQEPSNVIAEATKESPLDVIYDVCLPCRTSLAAGNMATSL